MVGDFGSNSWDGGLEPWRSGVFGFYRYGSVSEFVSMEETEEYATDSFGLKTLDQRGALTLKTVPNVQHGAWVSNYATVQQHVLPHLGDCPLVPNIVTEKSTTTVTETTAVTTTTTQTTTTTATATTKTTIAPTTTTTTTVTVRPPVSTTSFTTPPATSSQPAAVTTTTTTTMEATVSTTSLATTSLVTPSTTLSQTVAVTTTIMTTSMTKVVTAVTLTVTLNGLNFTQIDSNPIHMATLIKAIKTSFLAQLPSFYTENDLVVELSSGTLKATVSIAPLSGTTTSTLMILFSAQQQVVQSSVLAKAKAMATLDASILETGTTAEALTVTVMVVNVVPPAPTTTAINTVPLSGSMQAHQWPGVALLILLSFAGWCEA